jgi:hypothetical protein
MKLPRLCALLAICIGSTAPALAQEQQQTDTIPHKIQHRINPWGATSDAPTAGGTGQMLPAIAWNGGPVMAGAPDVHLIWYGNWNQSNGSDTAAGQTLVRDFISGLGGSNHIAINKAYTGSGGTQVTGNVGTVQEANVGYLKGIRAKRLRDTDITTIVTNYINSHGGAQPNAVYFVLTSSDVNETSGFCRNYCGWHTNGTIGGVDVKYSFVGNANRCLSSCAAQTTSPNGNAGVDGMISVIAHEFEETLTDPDPRSGWTDANGAENADKCAWTFGQSPILLPGGAYYNVTLPAASIASTRNYLIQRNLATNSKCYIDGITNAQ